MGKVRGVGLLLAGLIVQGATTASGAIYYVQISPGTPAANCTQAQDIATPHDTIAEGVACMTAGDTLYLRGGTYPSNQRVDLQSPTVKTGTSSAWITIAGYPGERPILQYADTIINGYGPIKARGNIAYVRFENITLDGVNTTAGTRWQIRDGNHHFTLSNLEIKNFPGSLIVTGNDVQIINCDIHATTSPTAVVYGIYFESGSNGLIDGNHIYDNNGGGIHVFPGPVSNLVIRNNRVHHNNYAASGSVPGILVYEDIDYKSGTAIIDGVDIYNNVVYENGVDKPSGTAGGIRVANGAANVRVLNNTVVGNNGYGISVYADGNGPPVDTIVQNNITTNNIGDDYSNTGTNTTVGYNACTAAESCGSTGKVTLSSSTEPFVDSANDDYRLKQGMNPVRDAGTSVSVRPSPVDGTDIGADEQGKLVSAAVTGGYIEVAATVMTAPLLPSSGVTGFTITCVGCTGSPVVSQAVLKAGSSTVLQLAVSGITETGSCTISLGGTNLKDSGFVGTAALGFAQGLNSVSGLSVAGTCSNTVGGGGAPTPTHSRFQLDEGSGTVANDDSGNGNHGTVSSGVTWVTGANGTGVTIPTDATFRHVATTYGSGVDPTTQSFAPCIKVIPDTALGQKVYLSAGGNGANQRAYVGITSVGGQMQWGLGIQASAFLTGSEFPVKNQMTLVCVVFDAGTDTATLWIDGVKGTISGKSVKSYTSYTLVGNLRVGNDGTFTNNNGGFTVYMVWLWNTKPSDADLEALYVSEFPAGAAVSCYGQATHKAELIYTDVGSPIAYGPAAAGYEVVDGGGIAAVLQVDCTGTAGGAVTLRFYYSTDGTNFIQEIPALLGAGGMAMWGVATDVGLNSGVATCCISGGLTANHGVTLITSSVSPTINLSTNHSYTIRLLLRFSSGLVNQSRWILAKQDNGIDLANAPTLGAMRFNIVNPRGGGMP